MTSHFHKTIPKHCVEIKILFNRELRPDYYFYNPQTRSIFRRTRKSESDVPMFLVMKGDTFQPRLSKGPYNRLPKLQMEDVKNELSKMYPKQ